MEFTNCAYAQMHWGGAGQAANLPPTRLGGELPDYHTSEVGQSGGEAGYR